MNEQTTEEKLSALVDGELDAHGRKTAIDSLLNDHQARQRWQRHHLISDALKRNLPPAIEQQLADNVMTALKNEPTILAPRRREGFSLTQRIAGLAVAASVAAVGVLGVQFMYQNDGLVQPQEQMAQVPATTQSFPVAGMPSAMQPGVQLVTEGGSTQSVPRVPPDLGKYLLDHNQQVPRSMQGVVPYARIVTYPNTSQVQDQSQGQR